MEMVTLYIKREMKNMNVNNLGLYKTRLVGARGMHSDYCRIINSGGNNHKMGVGIILDKERAKAVQ